LLVPMVGVIVMSYSPKPAIRARRGRSPRKMALRGLLVLGASLAAMFGPVGPSALAIVTPIKTNSYGVTPRSTLLVDGFQSLFAKTEPENFSNASGHAVVHSSNVYAVYWDPTDHYHGDWQHNIDGFLHNAGAESGSGDTVFSVDTQYLDRTNHRGPYSITYRGAYTDTDPYPTPGCTDPKALEVLDAITCITDAQIQEELKAFIAQHKLQAGMNAIFYLLTPPGVTACLDAGGSTGHCSDYELAAESYKHSFCSYHADINPTKAAEGDASTILYAVVPWTAGGLGDYHLLPKDRRSAYDCQDGGYDPSSKPIEQPELAKEKTTAEEEAFAKMTKKEQEKQEEKEALEGPHQQEPNQVIGAGPDGSPDTGLADLIINQIAIQQQDTMTNPLLDAWQDPSGNEVADECRDYFAGSRGGSVTAQEGSDAGTLYNQTMGGGNYYLNDAFNLAALKLPYPGVPCINGLNLVPQFTSPNPVASGEIVGFNGMESDISLNAGFMFSPTAVAQPTYATYTWDFGDGTPPVSGYAPGAPSENSPAVLPCAAPWEAPCAASTFHSFQYGGTYNVTLTVTDIGGNTASVTEPITVVGPPPPSSNPSGGATGGGSTTPVTPAASTPPSPGSGSPPTPAPVLGASVQSKSLNKALSGGLAVRYTTNEQVAGSIQVLLDAATAKRLGVHGATATGLPAGTPRAIVVGTAVLVTTKAGQGTIRIKFSKSAAARLKRTHKLKLMLRLFARNASRQSPQTTTLLSTITLNR
jgi:hypothetical protein